VPRDVIVENRDIIVFVSLLYGLLTIMYLIQTIFLGVKFCSYSVVTAYGTCILLFLLVLLLLFVLLLLCYLVFFPESMKLFGLICNTIISFLTLGSSLALYFPIVRCKLSCSIHL